MADYNTVPRGVANSGAAVVYGDGLGGLKWLRDTDKLNAKLAQREKETAARAEQDQAKAYATAIQGVNADTGLTYGPLGRQNVQKFYSEAQEIMRDKTLDRSQRLSKIAEKRTLLENSLKTGVQAEQHLKDTFGTARTNPNFDQAAVIESLRRQQHRPDGSIIPPEEYNPQAAEQAVMHPKNFNLGNVYKGLAKDLFQRDSEELEKAARPGGIGTKAYLESNAMIERDPVTLHPILNAAGEPILKFTPSTVLAAKSNPYVAMHLGSVQAEREKMEEVLVQKMQQNQPLSEEETQYLEQRQQGGAPSFEQDLAQQLTPYVNYSTRHQETFRPAPQPRAGRVAAGPKFSLTGGRDYAPEVIGGNGIGGTHGLTALAASEPLKRVKADGTAQDFEAEGLHRQYVMLKNGQASNLISNNAAPQRLRYIKPMALLTSSTGNVVTPTSPALLEAYQRGDRQPLLDWVRNERERDPKLKIEWHFLAAPAQRSKLTVGTDADVIYQRLRAADSTKPADVLRATAQKMAEQESASMLVPYKGSDKLQIDAATNYMLRDAKRKQRMQREMDYLTTQTAPRPASQRVAATSGLYTRRPAPAAPAPAKARPAAPTKPAKPNAGLY